MTMAKFIDAKRANENFYDRRISPFMATDPDVCEHIMER